MNKIDPIKLGIIWKRLNGMIDEVAEKYNAKIEYIDMPSKLKGQYQEYTCADNAKLHNTIAMRHWHTIEEYINGTD